MVLHEFLDHERPDRARDIIARSRHRHGETAPAREPVRHIGKQWSEGGSRAKSDQDPLKNGKDRKGRRLRGEQETASERRRCKCQRTGDPETVHHAPKNHVADGKTDHRCGIGQRGIRPVDREVMLYRRKHDNHRPHARTANGGKQHRKPEPQPGIGTVDPARLYGSPCLIHSHHFPSPGRK